MLSGSTKPRKITRTEEGFHDLLHTLDLTLEMYRRALNDGPITVDRSPRARFAIARSRKLLVVVARSPAQLDRCAIARGPLPYGDN